MKASDGAAAADWLDISRRAAAGVRMALARYSGAAERTREISRGAGGDMTLALDRDAEDAVFAELEATGVPLTVVSEERGRVELAGGGRVHVVVDPVDGSLNAKRGLPFHAVSIAVATGAAMGDVTFGYVADLASGEEWWARAGDGARRDGLPLGPLDAEAELEVLVLETARPERVAAAAAELARVGARRLRIPGSVALSLCLVADGRVDAMVTLGEVRSVDVAAAQLVVREAGGAVTFPGGPIDPSLGLEMRARIAAAASPALLERVAELVESPGRRAQRPPWHD